MIPLYDICFNTAANGMTLKEAFRLFCKDKNIFKKCHWQDKKKPNWNFEWRTVNAKLHNNPQQNLSISPIRWVKQFSLEYVKRTVNFVKKNWNKFIHIITYRWYCFRSKRAFGCIVWHFMLFKWEQNIG